MIWPDKYKAGYWFTLSLFEYFVLYTLFDIVLKKIKLGGGKYDVSLCMFAFLVFAVSTGHVAWAMGGMGMNNKVYDFFQLSQLKFFIPVG